MQAAESTLERVDLLEMDELFIDPDFKSKPICSVNAYFSELKQRVGRIYGLQTIDDAE